MTSERMAIGILIPANLDESPRLVPVADHRDIQEQVGGVFDVVVTKVSATPDPDDDPNAFALVAYVHDEGLLIDLPMNDRACMVFRKHLVGDVLLLSGTNPTSGEYDGDNYDVPSWFLEPVMEGVLDSKASEAHTMADAMASAVEMAISDGLFPEDQMGFIFLAMEANAEGVELPSNIRDIVDRTLTACMAYYTARKLGQIPRHDAEGERLAEQGVTDEMLAEFFDNETGGE
jgi:hypothetical protein